MENINYDRKKLLFFLNQINVKFEEHNHEHLFTVEQSQKLRGKIKGCHTKNLFMKNKKDCFFLLSCLEEKKIDLKKLKITLESKTLSFASHDKLNEILKIEPVSVSPFGLINDIDNKTKFFLDDDILKSDTVNFHPLVNNFTINIKINDFIIFLKNINVELNIIDLKHYKIIEKYGRHNNK